MVEDLQTLLERAAPAPRSDSVTAFAHSLWRTIRPRRKLFVQVAVITTVLAVALMLAVPRKFTARATVLPAGSKGGSMMGLLSQVAGLAGLGDGGSTEMILPLYPAIARSRTVLWSMLHMPYGNGTILTALADDPRADSVAAEQVLRTLQERLVAKSDLRVGLVVLEYTLPDRELAAAVVNGILEQMDRFFRYNLMTEAKNKRLMIEHRITEVSDSMRLAEDRLQRFHGGNRAITNSPALMADELRLRREVEILNAVYTELTKQYELAKIQEAADTPIMKVLDRATPPYYKSWPPRVKYVLLLVLLGQLGTLLFLRWKEWRFAALLRT